MPNPKLVTYYGTISKYDGRGKQRFPKLDVLTSNEKSIHRLWRSPTWVYRPTRAHLSGIVIYNTNVNRFILVR